MESSNKTAAEARLIKALSHPLRFRILIRLNEGPSSPSRLADELGELLGNVSYHVKVLLEFGAIELVDTRPVRGTIEHIYRATARPYFDDHEHWAKLPVSARRQFQDSVLQSVWEHLVEASDSGGLDDPETHLSRTDLDLDQQAYDELGELLDQVLNRALELHAEAAGRLAERPREERRTERTELAILHFHRVSDQSARPSEPATSRQGQA